MKELEEIFEEEVEGERAYWESDDPNADVYVEGEGDVVLCPNCLAANAPDVHCCERCGRAMSGMAENLTYRRTRWPQMGEEVEDEDENPKINLLANVLIFIVVAVICYIIISNARVGLMEKLSGEEAGRLDFAIVNWVSFIVAVVVLSFLGRLLFATLITDMLKNWRKIKDDTTEDGKG